VSMLTKIGRTAWQNRSDSKNQTDFGCSCKRGVSVIMLVTTTPYSDTLVLALATLGGTTEMGPFLFVVILPKVAKASTVVTVTWLWHDCHVSLSLMVSLTNFANVNDP
jgi:hypothetical protein